MKKPNSGRDVHARSDHDEGEATDKKRYKGKLKNSERSKRRRQHVFEAKIKTQICKHWGNGYCKLENKCIFAHGEEELQPEPDKNTAPKNQQIARRKSSLDTKKRIITIPTNNKPPVLLSSAPPPTSEIPPTIMYHPNGNPHLAYSQVMYPSNTSSYITSPNPHSSSHILPQFAATDHNSGFIENTNLINTGDLGTFHGFQPNVFSNNNNHSGTTIIAPQLTYHHHSGTLINHHHGYYSASPSPVLHTSLSDSSRNQYGPPGFDDDENNHQRLLLASSSSTGLAHHSTTGGVVLLQQHSAPPLTQQVDPSSSSAPLLPYYDMGDNNHQAPKSMVILPDSCGNSSSRADQ